MASSRVSAVMTPRIGPKYSVRWYSLPGRTPARTPGDHSFPVSSSCRGSMTQCSPSPSCVSPRSSLPSGAAMTGPICAVMSSGWATCRERTASTSWLRKRREVAAVPTRITVEAAEHFCPAWPKADCTTSLTARSRSACGVTMMEFFPEVSPNSCRSGRKERNSSAVS
ncbi:Uncharacterised protein [Mycobacteroides abscessus subsp. abscessus]|nr:Uncharacterised protein [Mycobacteroides abscessus subsp. abscessus]